MEVIIAEGPNIPFDFVTYIFTYISPIINKIGFENFIIFIFILTEVFSYILLNFLLPKHSKKRILIIIFIYSTLFAYFLYILQPPVTIQPQNQYGSIKVKNYNDVKRMDLISTTLTSIPYQNNNSLQEFIFNDFIIEKETKRRVILRGVNIGGSKTPFFPINQRKTLFNDENDHLNNFSSLNNEKKTNFTQLSAKERRLEKLKEFYNYKDGKISFVNRPFPLNEADEHFARISTWGLNLIRLCITWEAVEPSSPSVYDFDYLNYLLSLVRKAKEYGIMIYIDPHQDVWSRWTGGDGAPAWTMEKLGMKIERMVETGAAINQQEYGKEQPQMSWITNYGRYSSRTLFTLFFAGNYFAPITLIDGQSAQDFLQSHYFLAMKMVAKILKNEKNVIGFETLNEPSSGFVTPFSDLRSFNWPVRIGSVFTSWQSILLANGFPQVIDWYCAPFVYSYSYLANPNGISLYGEGYNCIWKENGVWGLDDVTGKPILKKPFYFSERKENGNFIHFENDFMIPFYSEFASHIRSEMSEVIIFACPSINFDQRPFLPVDHPSFSLLSSDLNINNNINNNDNNINNNNESNNNNVNNAEEEIKENNNKEEAKKEKGNKRSWEEEKREGRGIIYSPHWYDGIQLLIKTHLHWLNIDVIYQSLLLGSQNIISSFSHQLFLRKIEGRSQNLPTIIGEVGIAMDMDRSSYWGSPIEYFNIDDDYNKVDDDDHPFAYRSNDFTKQILALDNILQSLERNLLSFTLWCYVADNTNSDGDHWNGEDLSLFSRDQQISPSHFIENNNNNKKNNNNENKENNIKDNNNNDNEEKDMIKGGRGVEAIIRPYARRIAGNPISSTFYPFKEDREFKFTFKDDPSVTLPVTEFFIPYYQYYDQFEVIISDGEYQYFPDKQTLLYSHSLSNSNSVHSLVVRLKSTNL